MRKLTIPPEAVSGNFLLACLSQALLGSISSNFRAVFFTDRQGDCEITFVLEDYCADDLEEIQDILGEFEALTIGDACCDKVVIYGNSHVSEFLAADSRMVYLRKEEMGRSV